jgi:hypothetical protein
MPQEKEGGVIKKIIMNPYDSVVGRMLLGIIFIIAASKKSFIRLLV